MNNRRIAAIAAVMSLTAQSAGAQINKISGNYETGVWRVQGSFQNVASDRAAATVLKPGKTVGDSDAYAYAAEIPINDDGSFDAYFKLDSDSGEYMLRIGADGQVFERNFVFLNKAEAMNYLSRINSAATAQELALVFEGDYGRLKNICSVSINPADKDFVYGSLFAQKPQSGFVSFDKLKKTMAQVALLNEFMTETSKPANKLEKLFDYFDDKYLPAVEIWNDALLCDDAIKSSVCAKLQSGSIKTIAELEDAFAQQTIILALESAQATAKGRELTVIKIAHTLIGASEYSYFSGLDEDKQIAVLKNISSASYQSLAAYAKGFDKAAADFKGSKSDKTGTPGGSSSSRDTGFAGYVPGDTGDKKDTEKENESDNGFTDIGNYPWASGAIERLSASGIVSGRGNGEFAPSERVKREEFTSMIVKAIRLYSDSSAYDGFSDVVRGEWFYSAVSSAAINSIVSGISASEFGIGRDITRQDAVLICKKAAEAMGLSFDSGEATHTSFEYSSAETASFADWSDVSEYAQAAVTAMQKSGVISGNEANEFKPTDSMTRAEAAVLCDKLMQLIEGANSTVDDKDAEMLKEMAAFGVYNGGSEALGRELTRGEAAELICSLAAIPKAAVESYTFSDCGETNTYAQAVYAAVQRGYFPAAGAEFRPDASLDYTDAVRAAVIAIGAEPIAVKNGGTNEDYARIAAQKGLLSDVKRTSGGSITKRDFLKLFYNAFDKSIFLANISVGETTYTESKDETFLSSYHKIYKENGKVTANSRAGIAGDSRCAEGKLKINSAELICKNSEYGDYIGREVTYYYKETDGGDYELVYLAQRGKTNILTLDSSQLDSYKNLRYTYEPEGSTRKKTLDITSSVNVIYNTQTIYDYTDAQLLPKSGTVTFIDANGDGRYTKEDTIIIKDYKNIVVGGINKTKGVIYDKYNPNAEDGYTLDLDKVENYTIKDKHGDVYGLSELREWDVVAALVSPDKEYAELTLVDESYAGRVKSVDLGENEIRIDDVTYEIGKDWRGDLSIASPGSDVTLYWDLFGKVTAVRDGIASNSPTSDSAQTDNLTQKMVVLTAVKYDGEADADFIRSYYLDDRITKNYLAEKVKVNGTRIESGEVAEKLTNDLGKIVLIYTDETETVNEIITAALPGEDKNRGLWQINYPGESMLYKNDTKTFGNRFIAGDNIYTVPKDSDDYRDVSMFAYNNASFVSDQSYTVDAYTTNINNIRADAVVYKAAKNATASYDDSTGYVISSIKEGLNADDDVVLTLDGYSYDYVAGTASAASYELDEKAVIVDVDGNIRTDITLDELEAGDCIRFGLNNGKINSIMLAYDYSENKVTANTSRSGYTYEGYAYSMSDDQGYLSITLEKHPDELDITSYANGGRYINSFWIRNASLVTVVDKTGTKAEVKAGTMSDILTYKTVGNGCSRVVLFSSWQSFITGIVVYVE